jgi:hypothetical protein
MKGKAEPHQPAMRTLLWRAVKAAQPQGGRGESRDGLLTARLNGELRYAVLLRAKRIQRIPQRRPARRNPARDDDDGD